MNAIYTLSMAILGNFNPQITLKYGATFYSCHIALSQTRNRFYSVNSRKEFFNTIPSKKIIDYLKEINLYSRI
jgi:hypothetical protein